MKEELLLCSLLAGCASAPGMTELQAMKVQSSIDNDDQEFEIEAGAVLESADNEVVFAFTIPKTVEEDDQYKLEITVEGKDGNKARYEVRW